jgi:heme-degrading monooxygenase HmoA
LYRLGEGDSTTKTLPSQFAASSKSLSDAPLATNRRPRCEMAQAIRASVALARPTNAPRHFGRFLISISQAGATSGILHKGETRMIAVIFEVWPKPGGARQAYLDLAAELRPLLAEIDGFISVERFESLTEPGKLLSLSVFRDEAAVAAWRKLDAHRRAQARGRNELLARYRLRIAGVIRDYGMEAREEAPQDSVTIHG